MWICQFEFKKLWDHVTNHEGEIQDPTHPQEGTQAVCQAPTNQDVDAYSSSNDDLIRFYEQVVEGGTGLG